MAAKRVTHKWERLVVRYKGHLWRVISAHVPQNRPFANPTLTLIRPFCIQAAAFEHELELIKD